MEAAGMSSDVSHSCAHVRLEDPVPALEAEPGSVADRVGERLSALHPGSSSSRHPSRLPGAGFGHDRRRSALHRDDSSARGPREGRREAVQWLVDERTPTRNDLSFYGSEISGGIAIPIVVVLVALGFAICRHWLPQRFVLVARARVGDVPRDRLLRRSRTAGRAPARGAARRRELPLRPRCGLDRGVLGSRAAAHVARHVARRAHASGRSPSPCRSSSAYRACTAACTTHSTSLAGVLMGIAALVLVVFVARVTGVVARGRDDEGAARAR